VEINPKVATIRKHCYGSVKTVLRNIGTQALGETGQCALSNGGFPEANTRKSAMPGYSMFIKQLSLCSWQ